MSQALVVGGSGMLSELSLALAQEFDCVSVLARSSGPLVALATKNSKINPIQVDYTNASKLHSSIAEAIQKNGPVSLAVSWIHDSAPDASLKIAEQLNAQNTAVHYFHVLGSAYGDPSDRAALVRNAYGKFSTLHYHQVILGFVIQGTTSRWLNHNEISKGVHAAIKYSTDYSVVGTTTPWNKRP